MILNPKEKIRPAAVAGQFYPEKKKELEEILDGFLAQAKVSEIKGEVFGLLLPHAGYIFSGRVAASGIKTVAGRNFDTCVLIGDSHYERFDGISVWASGRWETPLGQVEADEEIARKILSFSGRFTERDSAHFFEHSLEVQIPFLQTVLGEFKIVPIIFGSEDEDWQKLAEAVLRASKGKKILVVASSDLSHYPPYEKAKEEDLKTLEIIEGLDIEGLDREILPGFQTFICAKDSVKTLIKIAQNLKGRAKILKYANSGDVFAGDKEAVVGYGTVVFSKG